MAAAPRELAWTNESGNADAGDSGSNLVDSVHLGDESLDICLGEDIVLLPGCVETIDTKIRVKIPPGYIGRMWERGTYGQKGVFVLAGKVDEGYHDTLKLTLGYLGKAPLHVSSGGAIAHLSIWPVCALNSAYYKNEDFVASIRGSRTPAPKRYRVSLIKIFFFSFKTCLK